MFYICICLWKVVNYKKWINFDLIPNSVSPFKNVYTKEVTYFLYSFTTHTILKPNLDYGCKKPIVLYCVIINYRLLGFS